MRIMFISDIHGTKTNLELIKNRYEELKCEKLVVLGDLYYIGPRNKMNEGYDIKYVQEFLSSFKDNLICIRGNCDSDVDVMVSDFPIVNELGLISLEDRDIYLSCIDEVYVRGEGDMVYTLTDFIQRDMNNLDKLLEYAMEIINRL